MILGRKNNVLTTKFNFVYANERLIDAHLQFSDRKSIMANLPFPKKTLDKI